MRSAALVSVAKGKPDSASRVSVQAAKIAGFVDDNGGTIDIVINVSEMKMFEIIDALRAQQIKTVYIHDITNLSVYAGKIIAMMAILEELDVEVLSVADGGRISNDSLKRMADKLTAQIVRDAQIG